MSSNILYSFRRCPFAIRARWALIACDISVELREVSLSNKPEELKVISPKGTVPVLITSDGKIIDESLDIIKWALMQTDSNLKHCFNKNSKYYTTTKNLIESNDIKFKYHLDRYKYSNRYPSEEIEYHKKNARDILIDWNKRIIKNKSEDQNGWIISNNQTVADWCLWPFVRQYRSINKTEFDDDPELKMIKSWLEFYILNKDFPKLMQSFKPWEPNHSIIIFP